EVAREVEAGRREDGVDQRAVALEETREGAVGADEDLLEQVLLLDVHAGGWTPAERCAARRSAARAPGRRADLKTCRGKILQVAPRVEILGCNRENASFAGAPSGKRCGASHPPVH